MDVTPANYQINTSKNICGVPTKGHPTQNLFNNVFLGFEEHTCQSPDRYLQNIFMGDATLREVHRMIIEYKKSYFQDAPTKPLVLAMSSMYHSTELGEFNTWLSAISLHLQPFSRYSQKNKEKRVFWDQMIS